MLVVFELVRKVGWGFCGVVDSWGMMIRHDDPECRDIAEELLRRHGELQAEANITSGIREFLVRTGLVELSDIREEIAPAEGVARAGRPGGRMRRRR